MNLYSVFCFITADREKATNYVISDISTEIILPIKKIDSARYIHNESRYFIKSLFTKDSYKHIDEIVFNYIDIQNEFLLEYLKKTNNHSIDITQDLLVLYGGIIEKKPTTKKYWQEFEYSPSKFIENPVLAVIDMVIQRSLI